MATKKTAKRTRRAPTKSRSLAALKAGDRVQEGTIVEVHNGAALIGREPASDGEQPAPGEVAIFVKGRRVFLAAGQVFIPLSNLHRLPGTPTPGPRGQTTSEYHFTVFQDGGGLWRWRILARNGRVVADSGEGYASKANAHRAVDDLNNTDWPISVVDA